MLMIEGGQALLDMNATIIGLLNDSDGFEPLLSTDGEAGKRQAKEFQDSGLYDLAIRLRDSE